MLQSLILVGVLSLAIAADVLTIEKISRTSGTVDKKEQEQIEICITDIGSYHHYHLSIILNIDTGVQDQGKSVSVKLKCITFKGNITQLGSSNTVEFILTGQTDQDVTQAVGTAIIKLPDFLEPLTAHWVDTNSLRIAEGDVKGFKIGNTECKKGDDHGVPCYFIGIKIPMQQKPVLQLCKTKKEEAPETKTITICDLTQKGAPETGKDNELKSLLLQYKKDGTGDKMTMERTEAVTSEIVVYTDSSDPTTITVCATAKNPNDCALSKYDQGDQDVSVLVVGIDTDPVDSKVHTITDLNLVGTALSTSLMEIRWTAKKDVDGDKYFARRTGGTLGDVLSNEFTSTVVTCHVDNDKSDNFHCFAYFVGLTPASTYEVTVQPGDGSTNIDTNQVTLTEIVMTPSFNYESMELKISSLDTKWNKGLRRFEINTCIHQAKPSNLSAYEAILINNSGQWKKIHGATHRTGNELCFDALHLNSYDFDLSEDMTLAVIRRADDGITVLESYQTNINVGGNKIATSLSNSSSGAM